MLPAAITEAQATVFGQWIYVWSDAQGSQVVQLIGGFRCDLGSSHLRARDAVMWLKPAVEGGRRYVQLEFFLWQDASVVSPGGAVVEGATLFATAATYGGLRLAYDRKADSSAAETSLFQDAQRVRQASAAGTLQAAPPPPLSTLHLRLPEDKQTQITFSPGPKAQILDGEWVATLTEGVYFSRGTPGTDDFLEGSADAAVLFAVPPTAPDQPRPAGDSVQPQGLEQLRGIYLEGDVVLQQALRSIRAERLFVDLENSKALILDPVVRVGIAGRTVPVYIRAREARQLSKNEVVAQNVKMSTSEFYTPHFYIGAEELFVTADGPGGPLDSPAGTRTGSYRIEGGSLNVGGLEGPPWVNTTGDIGDSQLSLRGARISNSNDFGFSLETKWDLFKVAGQKKPESVRDADLLVDMYTDRGVGVGVDSEYENDVSFGLMRGYFIYDLAKRDDLGPNRADEDIQHPARGRATWRHRQYLQDDWQFTIEASYMSDQNFLEEYFENEFENDKPQETYFQLKKQRDNWALTILEQVRINNWLTQTESLPDLTFRLYGAKLGAATVFSESRAGLVRYRPDDDFGVRGSGQPILPQPSSGVVLRGDTREEVELPLQVGPVKLVPFATGRASWWDDSPKDGGLCRGYGIAGVRGSLYLSHTDRSVASDLFAINGLRHIIKIDGMSWVAGTNVGSDDLYPFTPGVEDIDGISGGSIGVRQRWQTRRGAPGRERTVDLLSVDVEAGFFSGARQEEDTNGYVSYTRPEESLASNYVSTKFNWRLGDTTYLLGDGSVDVDDGQLDIANLTLAVERTPRLAYLIGWRMIDEVESNLLGFGFTYKASEKHRFAMRYYGDVNRGATEQFDVTYVRKFPRWFASFTVSLDEINDNLSISMAVWPEGAPNVALGSKRYTGLETSTAIADQQ